MAKNAPDSADTQSLLERIQAGDVAASDLLLARHRPFLRQIVELRLDPRLRARVDPSDVVQEAQLDAFRRLTEYVRRRPMPFRLWLRKTAHERMLKIQRRHLQTGRRAIGREVPLPAQSSIVLGQQLLASGSTPSQHLDRSEVARRVRQAVARLPEADREVLLMRNFEGLSNQEIGLLFGLDAPTVSKRHGRALLRLRKLLLEGGLGGWNHD
jgi:RNA polymerase sigma-70 factor (ECF subfamily)